MLAPTVLYILYDHVGLEEHKSRKAPCDARCRIVRVAGAQGRGSSNQFFLDRTSQALVAQQAKRARPSQSNTSDCRTSRRSGGEPATNKTSLGQCWRQHDNLTPKHAKHGRARRIHTRQEKTCVGDGLQRHNAAVQAHANNSATRDKATSLGYNDGAATTRTAHASVTER